MIVRPVAVSTRPVRTTIHLSNEARIQHHAKYLRKEFKMETSTTTVLEHNMMLAQRVWNEVWHQGNFSVMNDIFDPNFIRHDPNGRELRGREQNEQVIRQTRAAFPDLQFQVEDVI